MMPLLFLLAVAGLALNLVFAESLLQPDWSLSLLLGALLAHRGYWPWIFAGTLLHDLVLYWSPFITLPWIMLAPLLMIWSDAQAGPSLVQRLIILGLFGCNLWFWGWLPQAVVLSLLLTIVVWHLVARKHAQPA